jgi:hypothetical protein
MEVAAVRGRGGSEEACVFCVVGGCKERRSQQQRRSEEKKRKSRPEKKNGKRSGGLNLWPAALKASRAGSVLLSLEHVECVAFGPSKPRVGEIHGPRKARRDSHSKKKETSPHLCCPKASKLPPPPPPPLVNRLLPPCSHYSPSPALRHRQPRVDSRAMSTVATRRRTC